MLWGLKAAGHPPSLCVLTTRDAWVCRFFVVFDDVAVLSPTMKSVFPLSIPDFQVGLPGVLSAASAVPRGNFGELVRVPFDAPQSRHFID